MMNSSPPGSSTSEIEVTNISTHGIWLLTPETEHFLSYEDFPWFKEKPIGQILNVEEPQPGHYYWPDLDVDLSEQILKNPDDFPLKSSST